ncbi:MAG: 2Fe-2S iron-sulfur cluster-binding protein [Alphaproteobacteria bacterium]|jgi:succinate dehydrogenase/fumarate reductase-like Fe-S protein
MEKLNITLYRFDPSCDSEPRLQSYDIKPDGPLSVLQAIRHVYHKVDGTLSFRNSDCRRGVCGICSMMINGRRQLTCMCLATDGMTVEPPPNRTVVKDLVFETD